MWRTGGSGRSKLEACTVASEFPSLYQIEAKARTALSARLPGAEAHLPLAPRPRHGWQPGHVPDGAKHAAGLVLLYPRSAQPHVVLTVRADRMAQHAGQVSLPGGALEPGETVDHAALREATEEVGLDKRSVRLLGTLSTLYIPVSHFALHPVVGVTDRCPVFRPATAEVGRLVEVPLELVSARPRRGYRWRGTERFEVPFFELGGERVWGATAMVLAELLAVLGAPAADPWDDERSARS